MAYEIPFSASLAFLTYGAMVDYKNLLMLARDFDRPFIFRLLVRVTVVLLIYLIAGQSLIMVLNRR